MIYQISLVYIDNSSLKVESLFLSLQDVSQVFMLLITRTGFNLFKKV